MKPAASVEHTLAEVIPLDHTPRKSVLAPRLASPPSMLLEQASYRIHHRIWTYQDLPFGMLDI
jgi:hypothetical protein